MPLAPITLLAEFGRRASWRGRRFRPGEPRIPAISIPSTTLRILAIMTGELKEAQILLGEVVQVLPEEPLIVSLQGVLYALTGEDGKPLDCVTTARASPNSFGLAHHSYYQIACILALLGRRGAAFDGLERSVCSGFACWPFFLKDPYLRNPARSRV